MQQKKNLMRWVHVAPRNTGVWGSYPGPPRDLSWNTAHIPSYTFPTWSHILEEIQRTIRIIKRGKSSIWESVRGAFSMQLFSLSWERKWSLSRKRKDSKHLEQEAIQVQKITSRKLKAAAYWTSDSQNHAQQELWQRRFWTEARQSYECAVQQQCAMAVTQKIPSRSMSLLQAEKSEASLICHTFIQKLPNQRKKKTTEVNTINIITF